MLQYTYFFYNKLRIWVSVESFFKLSGFEYSNLLMSFFEGSMTIFKPQVAENGSIILARFSNTYKCIKICSYLPVNCVKFLLNPLSVTQIFVRP